MSSIPIETEKINPEEVRRLARNYMGDPHVGMLAQSLIGCAHEIDRLREENKRLHKKAYLTIPLPRWLSRGRSWRLG